MSLVLLVGSGFSGVTEYLKAHNYDYIILKDRLTTRFPDKKLKRRVVCDFSSRESVLQTVDSIDKKITSVMTMYENYVLAASWISKHLGLPGMSEEAAAACTDKWTMRQAFAKAERPVNPDFTIVENEQDLRNFAQTHSFPLMLKPANLVKSLLVTKNESLDDLLANYQNMLSVIDGVYQKYAAGRQPTIIVEEFLRGTMHSVAAFADKHGNPHVVEPIVDLTTARDIGYSDNFLYSRTVPSRLNEKDQHTLLECAEVGMRALGMTTSPAHIEIILTDKGPRIVEIGARIGGYQERMYRLANDIDMVGAAVDTALGNQINITATKHEPVAVIELFPKNPGSFSGISNEADLRKLSSLSYFTIKAKPGQYVGKASEGYKMCAVVMLSGVDEQTFANDLDFIRKNVRVLTD